eukprot:TRINITY_DN9978_c0_g1_i1.p1 TRINITY_DN9978_c0_g1~~TRINITY_DN9978_c0_g1_i1.p1  ORF type:complete len:357 (-),score=79.34 TRINITY_DN9978_c0_g1_i1:97-1167(-)
MRTLPFEKFLIHRSREMSSGWCAVRGHSKGISKQEESSDEETFSSSDSSTEEEIVLSDKENVTNESSGADEDDGDGDGNENESGDKDKQQVVMVNKIENISGKGNDAPEKGDNIPEAEESQEKSINSAERRETTNMLKQRKYRAHYKLPSYAKPKLKVVKGEVSKDNVAKKFVRLLPEHAITFGSSEEADYIFSNSSCKHSPIQIQFLWRDHKVLLTVYQGVTTTLNDSEIVHPVSLQRGDMINIGDVCFCFTYPLAKLKGFLFKKSPHKMRITRQKRWCVLRDAMFCYYKSSNEQNKLGVIDLKSVDLVESSGSMEFNIQVGERVYAWRAQSDADKSLWLEGLQDHTAFLTRKNS